jgi:hypothetical protein
MPKKEHLHIGAGKVSTNAQSFWGHSKALQGDKARQA